MLSLRQFRRDDRGVSSVEFALLMPFLAAFLFSGVQVTNMLEANRKVSLAAAAAADLVAQAKMVTDADMNDIFSATGAILYPFEKSEPGNPGGLQVVVTSLSYVSETEGKVLWSDAHNASPRAKNDVVTIPKGILAEGLSVIMAEVSYTYNDPMGIIELAGLDGGYTLSDKYYDRPRRVIAVARTAS